MDREKVIKGLKQCISADETCAGCPYEGTTCTTTLNADVLAMLFQQDETIKELQNAYDYLQRQFFEVQTELIKLQSSNGSVEK